MAAGWGPAGASLRRGTICWAAPPRCLRYCLPPRWTKPVAGWAWPIPRSARATGPASDVRSMRSARCWGRRVTPARTRPDATRVLRGLPGIPFPYRGTSEFRRSRAVDARLLHPTGPGTLHPLFRRAAERVTRTAVLALGGNALARAGERATITNQFRHARESVAPIVELARDGWRIAIVHGNGPQVGDELARNEIARREVE